MHEVSGTRNVKSLELTRKPKETITKAGGESFSGEEAKPRVSKINCRVAKALSASDGRVQRRKNHLGKHPGGHLGIFCVGMCRPGLQIEPRSKKKIR